MDWLTAIAKMTREEFDAYMDGKGIYCTRANPHSETRTILGYPVTEEMWADANIPIAIFGVPSGGSSGNTTGNTTNGGQLTWTWPVGAGNTISNPAATPAVTQILYRRSTHDENGNAKQFTKEQEKLWQDLASIATMTSPYIWKTADEICRDATEYQKRTRATGVYIALSMVENALAILVGNGMVEMKNA